MSFTYSHPRPAVTVDCVVFGIDLKQDDLKVLLIQRDVPPFKGQWALPGGFVRMDENLDQAARRELFEETGIQKAYLEQLYTFGEVSRDPRGRVISVAYYALVNMKDHPLSAATDARRAEWASAASAPALSFDHKKILEMAIFRLKGKVFYEPVGFELLPKKFTLTNLRKVYEIILGKPLNDRNFRSAILRLGLVEALNEKEQDVPYRPAELYRFKGHQKARKIKDQFILEM